MDKVTVIIPIVGTTDDDKALLERAYNSAKKDAAKVIIVGPKDAIDKASEIKVTKTKTEFLVNDVDTSYPSQVMLAVDKVATDYFSVLEYDDTFTENWFKNVELYEDNDVMAYLPLTEIADAKTEEVIAYSNEAFWATSFSEVLGYLDLESLQDYLNFNMSGAVIRKKDFVSLGGLKTSMKLVFWYEFLLRVLYKQKKLYVVPKIGYIHFSNREGCLTDIYSNTMDEKEVEWWLDLAKKEYYFPQDRNKKYEKE